ncbi:hypothetical protein MKZ38_000733 [Zalerion maritima]|uniref:Aminoglycoside phosphotransferase domain-containing protein n=1 Tax=Zalerion maritima TaxID=339359 RepID=A0AAD5WN17_9PEZI|nr:hypothetical protein MKZ38_000733 [Zalerion maritima]
MPIADSCTGVTQLPEIGETWTVLSTDESYELVEFSHFNVFASLESDEEHGVCRPPPPVPGHPAQLLSSSNQEYSVDQEIADFFDKTSATRSACEVRAKELVGGNVIPVAVQGVTVCSYWVHAGHNDDFVVQFRPKSLQLRTETTCLAQDIYGSLAPRPLCIYVVSRVRGISHLDFVSAHNSPQNWPENFTWRKNLIADVARFLALAWKTPQDIDQASLDGLCHRYEKELRLLLTSLPDRFHPIIQKSLDPMLVISSLPVVLLHKDFGTCNIMVDSGSCHLVGVIDWAEAEIGPFGLNMHSLQPLMSQFHLKNGWVRYDDYDILGETFWHNFSEEVGGLGEEEIRTIKSARVVGLLLSSGFTSRLANMPKPVPIRDDESGAYGMRDLD